MDPSLGALVEELRGSSAEFTRLWEQRDVQPAPALTKTFTHSSIGTITLDRDTLALTDRDQHLVLYSAKPGSPDADALALLKLLGVPAGADG